MAHRQNFNVLLKNERIVQSIFDNLQPRTIRVIRDELKKEKYKKPDPPFDWNQCKLIVGIVTVVFVVLSFLIRWDVLIVQYASFWAFFAIYQKGWLSRNRKDVNIFADRDGKIKVNNL